MLSRSATQTLSRAHLSSIPGLLNRNLPAPAATLSKPSFPTRLLASANPRAPATQPPHQTFSNAAPPSEPSKEPLPTGPHPAVISVVNNVMKHGEKAKYEKLVAESLRLLQLKTNQNPVDLLVRALDTCAPLVKLLTAKRGNRRIQIPRPLSERARRRFAVVWIKQAADKKKGSFPVRFANELLLVLKGTSSALEKKAFVHKTALQNRTNVR